MDKMLVAIFESERQASIAAGALKSLWEDCILVVYAFAVIVKNCEKVSVVDFKSEDGTDPVLGIATRNLVKLLTRPLCSLDDGRTIMEMANADVDAMFLDEVSRQLLPGRAAIVSEIEEETATAMDALLESQGGIAFRCVRRGLIDAQIAKELDALYSELQFLKKTTSQDLGGSKAELQRKLDLAKASFEGTKERARHHAAAIKREAEAKIVSLQERAAKTDGRIKARLERLASEVRVDYVNRATKLNFAWHFAGDVFAV
jgi:hypothetical protein